MPHIQFKSYQHYQPARLHIPCPLRQCRSRFGNQQRAVMQSQDKQNSPTHLPLAGSAPNSPQIGACHKPQKHLRCFVSWRYQRISHLFPWCQHPGHSPITGPLGRQTDIVVAPVSVSGGHTVRSSLGPTLPLQLNSSPLRLHCRADEQIFLWKGINTPPASTINNPTIQLIAALASHASLCNTSSYGSGLGKFNLFCDIFTIPESDRLPASFPLLHSFALWAATDPGSLGPNIAARVPLKPVSIGVVRKYLSAICAWHVAQGWPSPLSSDDHDRINWSLWGLENIQGSCKRPVRPPITISMLWALQATLNLSDPFEACIWVMAVCVFWGMMRFREVSVTSHDVFDKSKHLKQQDVHLGVDLDGKLYAHLDLPSAKTAKPGEIQSIFLVPQEGLCPIEAFKNLAMVVPAGPDDPLFSWQDQHGDVRPMVKSKAIAHINAILKTWCWGTTFSHSFRISGTSFYLSQKVDPEIVCIAGRWRSLAYKAYIHTFELVTSCHLGGLIMS
jgi:hypothetical protein